MEKRVVDLDLRLILPNRFQPRIKFDEGSINELAESIKKHGVIQPIVVRQIDDKYEIIAGERRYKASVIAGKSTIPAIVSDLDDYQSVEVALIENVQRQDLTPIEEAVSYKKILDMGYMTQDDLAVKLGKSQSTVANKLRLLNLADDVQEALLDQRISERHARSLLKLSDVDKQVEVLNKIISDRLTVRKTDELIEKVLLEKEEPQKIEIINIDDELEGNYSMNNENFDNLNMPNQPIINDVPVIEPVNNGPIVEPIVTDNNIPTLDTNTPIIDNVFTNPYQEVESINPIEANSFNQSPVMEPISDVNTVYEPIATDNPGFINIEQMENTAQDIYTEKPIADINNLLETNNEVTPIAEPVIEPINNEPIESDENILTPGRFFNILGDNNETTMEAPVMDNINNEPTVDSQPTPFALNDNPVEVPNIENEYNQFFNPVITEEQPQIQYPSTPIEVSAIEPTNEEKPVVEQLNPVIDNSFTTPLESTEIPVMEPIFVPEQPVNPVVEQIEPLNQTFVSDVIEPENSVVPVIEETPIVDSVIDNSFAYPYGVVENINSMEPTSIETTPTETITEPVLNNEPITIQGNNVMNAVTTIRNSVNALEGMGYVVETDEADLGTSYQVTITINK